jgi:hypothetical protein
MRVWLVLYGWWVLQGLGIFLWARWAEVERKHSGEEDWVLYLE